uniref:F-box domain-containing protein n=1 Tax=Caenorhabditis tropicalis TaxID=1561998 RepID=A0A1I7UU39_9PELO
MTAFPLLQLPLVAMEHVLCMMNPFELIDVSLASSRARRCVKSFSRNKYKFSASFDNQGPKISLGDHRMGWIFEMTVNERYTCRYQHGLYNTETIIKFTKEPLKDIMKWFDYAREVLHCKINRLILDLDFPSSENRQIIDWIATQSNMMEWVDLLSIYEESGDDLKYLMERIHVSGRFDLMIKKYKNDFRMEIPGKPERLSVKNARFIDYEQLLRLKSPVIILRQSILTSQDINRFLKSWMTCETHLELKALEIGISDPDAINEIMDLPHEKTNDPKIGRAFYNYHIILQDVNEIFTMKRCDGKKQASVTTARLLHGWRLCLIVY